MTDIFSTTAGFSTLSIKDLLEARDLYHYHLMNKKNVVATALGYYRIRKIDTWPSKSNTEPNNSKNKDIPRTLENSEVRPYSWPAILVFVEQWVPQKKLADQNPGDVVPKTLYLPDGRSVPVCVIEAKRQLSIDDTVDESIVNFPKNLISGGYPVTTVVQGVPRIASVGCLVTDGHLTYALTNKHVTGQAGTPICTQLAGEEVLIGKSSSKQLGRIPFSKVYDGWSFKNTYLNMDIGLIEVNDVNQWKTEVFNVGTLGRMVDLSVGNFSLNLIGQPVAGYGSISGKVNGEIKALFYRYKSIGGFEYVSDFLIGSSDDTPLNIHNGDSGTVMLYERQETTKEKDGTIKSHTAELMPIALLWGQHIFYGNGEKNRSPYALATCLSTACNLLGVDLLADWNTNQPDIWGKTGHYGIGNLATTFIKDTNLAKLMKQNVENISFDLNHITADWDSKNAALKEKYQKLFAEFCPLADVPDIIWKQSKAAKWGRKGDENPNHYMDADLPCKKYPKDINYLEYATNKSKVSVKEITDFYKNVDYKKVGLDKAPNQGIVPLRVWQIFNYMVDALSNKKPDLARFIFGAGVLTHYVGDACQPLHSSYMADGDPADNKTVHTTAKVTSYHRDGTLSHTKGDPVTKIENAGAGVHVAYEDHMIDDNVKDVLKGIQAIQKKATSPVMKELITPITDGQSAAFAIIELMQKTHKTLAPVDIVKAFKKHKGEANLTTLLWKSFGTATIECMARGARYQAAIWQAAWTVSGVNPTVFAAANCNTPAFKKQLKALYNNPKELKSYSLSTIQPVLK